MEFASRHQCIEHFQGQFPNLPRYMIEMATDQWPTPFKPRSE